MSATTSASASGQGTLTSISSHNQYDNELFDYSDLSSDPITQFDSWFKAAQDSGVQEPEAMTVATCDVSSPGAPRPSSRVVLLKQVKESGFVFYTNYSSRKGGELDKNPWCSLTFYWKELSRSVRVCGKAVRLSKDESQAYFDSRPVGSRVGAHASPQSQKIAGRDELEKRVEDVEQRFGVPGAAGLKGETPKEAEGKKIPVPDFWGGWIVVPDEVEFWVGRKNRLHDRYRFTRPTDNIDKVPARSDKWTIDRLAP